MSAQLRVIVTVRPKYACRRCQEGVPQAPARLIAGGLLTEGTIAHLLISKYSDHYPLYRLCRSQEAARCCAADYDAEALIPHGDGRFSSACNLDEAGFQELLGEFDSLLYLQLISQQIAQISQCTSRFVKSTLSKYSQLFYQAVYCIHLQSQGF